MKIKTLPLAISLTGITVLVGTLLAFKTVNSPSAVYQYRQFSTVESIIPAGLGRSRLIATDNSGTMIEKDLKNFYSLVGINFNNITNNDRVIVDKINDYSSEGWELISVVTGVQSPNDRDGTGIFITRYLFRKGKD